MATMNPPVNERRHVSDRRTVPGSQAKKKMNALDWIALVLMIVGGLNWGLVGLINTDVVANVFGTQSPYARVLYVLVGLAALYAIYPAIKMAVDSRPHATHA